MSAQHHGHPLPNPGRECRLLVVIDPAARRIDGEAVRIAKDVLCAGAATKICLPTGPEEVARALSRRGSRQPVVVGDDAALLRVVGTLHRQRTLGDAALALVPVGASAAAVSLARALGVPTGPVAAARAVLDGVDRRLDLLVDDSDGVVLGGLRIPALPNGTSEGEERDWWPPGLRACRRLVRSLRDTAGWPARPAGADHGPEAERLAALGGAAGAFSAAGGVTWPFRGNGGSHRLRVEADGKLLVDLDRPVEEVSVTTAGAVAGHGGLAHVVVRPSTGGGGSAPPVTARARAITVWGPDFRYSADAQVGGPVRTRTWTVRPAAWRLTLPRE